MTVAELIAKLQELPPDTKVITRDYEQGDISYASGFQCHTVAAPFGSDYLTSADKGETGWFEAIEII